MIRVDILESFPIVVSLVDELTGTLTSGATVTYDVRDSSDASLIPPITGTLTESTVASGVYKTFISIPTSGSYVCYASSSTYLTNTEDILVNPESVYDVVKQTLHYNTAIEDVVRVSVTPTASQVTRNVPVGKTDYIITRVKDNSDPNWLGTTTSGNVYCWYETVYSEVPYKMGGPN